LSFQPIDDSTKSITCIHKQLGQICHFFRADPAYGIDVANALGIDIDQFIPKGAAQPDAFGRKTLTGRHVNKPI
jgi:hypothetical protein